MRWFRGMKRSDRNSCQESAVEAAMTIVQIGTRADGTQTRWTFAEITADSFHWLGEALQTDGTAWNIESEFRANRRAGRR